MIRRAATVFLALGVWWCVSGGIVPGAPARLDAQGTPRSLLAIFAHPDDEQVVAPLLARYARQGVRVQLAIATDGRKGVRPHAGIPAGSALATARAAEARCACEKLGIQPPILFGLEDGGLAADENKRTLLSEVARLLRESNPDVVVTWGPDGVTGHTDHRMVSNVVTEVIQRGEPGTTRPLFYAGFPAERASALRDQGGAAGGGIPQSIALVAERYLPVRIPYEKDDVQAAADALACHKTQYTPEEVATMLRMARGLEDGAVRLRPWFVDSGPVTDLFK